MNEFTERVTALIRSVPRGWVTSYGTVAAAAGNPRAARQVARILHSCSGSRDLPWHRIVGAGGRIRLPEGNGREEQVSLLLGEA
jgi:methylated-DNA-protein-cysteine methyltransferase related protein